jgi:hypothetical protein
MSGRRVPFYEERWPVPDAAGLIDGALAPVVVDHPEWAADLLETLACRGERRFFGAMSTPRLVSAAA